MSSDGSRLWLFGFFFIIGYMYAPMTGSGQGYLQMIEQGGYQFTTIQAAANEYFDGKDKGKGSGYKQWKRWEFDAGRTLDDDGYVIDDFTRYQTLKSYNQLLNTSTLSIDRAHCQGDWQTIGPHQVSGRASYNPGIGRVTSISVDAQNPNHVLVGAETGGVWKSLDGGVTWESLSDEIINLKVSSLAIDPSNSDIYYWGISQGLIFKSLDGGSTWTELSYDSWGSIEKIVINPMQTQELWLADSNFGIFHSTDGGVSWYQVLEDKSFDLELHPTDPNTLYASGHDIWKSVDGGVVWNKLEFEQAVDRPIFIDVSEAVPDYLYILQSAGKNFEGIYISKDKGETIEQLYHGDKNLLGYDHRGRDSGGQAPRNMDIVVSDDDSDVIFIAGINLWRSIDGGRTFDLLAYFAYNHSIDSIAYCHADIECLEMVNEQLYIGSDGGIYKMDDIDIENISEHVIRDLSDGLNIRQIYKLGLAQQSPNILSVGAQDNGTALKEEDSWLHYGGGDGTETFIVELSEHILFFASSQYGTLFSSSDTGRTTQPLQGTYSMHGTGKWITPFEKDPNDELTIYAGFDRVYRSHDLGQTSEAISQDFHPSVIKVANGGSDTLYAASANNVYRTTDGGATTWDRILYANVNRGTVTDVAVHPHDANLVAVAVTGSTQIWLTRDGGGTWAEYDQGIFFSPLSLAWEDSDDESLYAGTTTGVVFRNKHTGEWVPYDFGLPYVKVNEIEIHKQTGLLFAATYGRGVWVSPLCDAYSNSTHLDKQDTFIQVHPNPVRSGENFQIKVNELDEVHFQLFNGKGQLVDQKYRSHHLDETFTMKAPTLPGRYYLRITSKSKMAVEPIVVVK